MPPRQRGRVGNGQGDDFHFVRATACLRFIREARLIGPHVGSIKETVSPGCARAATMSMEQSGLPNYDAVRNFGPFRRRRP